MRSQARGALLTAMLFTLLALVGTPAAAEPAPVSEPTESEVEEFLDARVPSLLEERGVPGAAVSVVSGGRQVFASGYGHADLGSDEPIAADRTAFPMSSIGKTFTAMALLQLVHDREIALDADVNDYLPGDLQISDTHPGQPVTAHHLLTHTAGFEEAIEGMSAAGPDDVLPLADYVRERQPERIYPPGRFVGYSNYGYALAGLLVEEITGRPFAEYAEEHLFRPLGMTDTAFAQPDEARQRFETPNLYTVDEAGNIGPAPEEYGNGVPSGIAVATATDMSRLMLALLNRGEVDGTRVLAPELTAAMMGRQHASHPELTAVGYGTYESASDGARVLGHDGDGPGTHGRYALVPEHDTGIFVVVNGSEAIEDPARSDVRDTVVEEFLTEFFGILPPAEPPHSAGSGDAVPADYTGTYRYTRFAHSDPSALVYALMGHTTVTVIDGASLHTAPAGMDEQEWIPLGDGLYRAQDGTDTLAFLEQDGEVAGLAFASDPGVAYERISWYEHPAPVLATAAAALLVMASAVAWPLAMLLGSRRGGAPAPSRGAPGRARLLAGVAALVCVGFTAFLFVVMSDTLLLEEMLMTGSPAFTVPLAVAAVPAVGALIGAVLAWHRRWWSPLHRLHFTAVAFALPAFLAAANHYNLLWTPFGS